MQALQQRSLNQAAGRRNGLSARTVVAAPSSRRSVQVFAKSKGRKGMGMMRGSPGVTGAPSPQQQMMQMREPPVPEVDPENAEFVVFVRARNFMDGKVQIGESKWVPLSIIKAGQAANYLVKAAESEWGRKLYSRTLIRNIGLAMYKDKDQIEKSIKQQYPPFANVPSKSFSYGFKIRDKSNPKAWKDADNITEIPPEAALQETAIDTIQRLFSAESLGKIFSA